MTTEHVHDGASEARYERCSVLFQRQLDAGASLEDIVRESTVSAGHAERVGNFDRVEDFLLIGSWAQFRLDQQRAEIEQGKAISNRMAAELGRRQALIEASIDISEAVKASGIKIGPPYEVMRRRRYGDSLDRL